MKSMETLAVLPRKIAEFVRSGFHPHFGELREKLPTNPTWERLRELGSELWLDTGKIEAIAGLWTREFTGLTTNNTLLNREVQKGTYDTLIPQAGELLEGCGPLSARQRMLELAFVLNAVHGLKLVERFDAHVSVEEHTGLADDLPAAVAYARRYHEICPERFIVKIPFTPAGLLATRKLSREGVPVNHTLGFSARQNYVIARVGRPQYVNVFLGRLNAFVADNHLGDGTYVGEKATLASQGVIRDLRERYGVPSRQIGASFRAPQQVRDLAGVNVMTIPPKVADGFLKLGIPADEITDRTAEQYRPGLRRDVDPATVALDTLWEVGEELIACVDMLENENLESFSPDDLVGFFAAHGCSDVLVDWSKREIATSYAEGKIPKLDNWGEHLATGRIGLDSLMNLAGLNSFAADQKAMDDRVREVLCTK